jgi:hypothetical protein
VKLPKRGIIKHIQEVTLKRILLVIALLLICLCTYLGYLYLREDDSSKSIVEAIEKARGDNYVNYIIHQQPVNNGMMVFFLRNFNDGQIQVSSGFVKKTRQGWKWSYGGSFGATNVRLDLSPEEAKGESFYSSYFPSTTGTEYDSPFPMIYGVILNPDISRIVVRDYITGLERQTDVVEINKHFKLFYVLIDDAQGKNFDIIAYDHDGGILRTETIDQGLQEQSGTSTVK